VEHSRSVVSQSWFGLVKLAVATGIAYFLVGRLGLALRAEPGVAVFWPASGIAVGALMALGPGARLPLAAGVTVATAACNLMIDRNPWLAVALGLLNAAQPLITIWLLERWFGRTFRLEDVQRVLGFFAATAIASAITAVAVAMAISLVEPTTFPVHVWRLWFAACALGVVTVAPLLVGLTDVLREGLPRRELIEGCAGFIMVTALSALLISLPDGPWATALPESLVFPFLLWIAMRCRPVFAAAAALAVGLVVIGSTTLNIGYFDPGKPLADRILSAQSFVLAEAVVVVLLAAVFAERRSHLTALENSNHRLQLALDCAELGTWSIHLKSGHFENDMRDRQIHGHGPETPPKSLAEMRSQVHPDDLPKLDATFVGLGHGGAHGRTEYRLRPPADEPEGRTRWVAIEGTVLRQADGRPAQLLGVTRDITEQKHAETRLREREQASRELLGALPAAIYVTDAAGRITYCNEAAINLWGATPKLGEDKWSSFSRFYHANGTPMALEECPTEIALTQGRPAQAWETILERTDGSRVPIIPYPKPLLDQHGTIVGVVNMTVDISERKKAEMALTERNAQLALAGRAALVGSYAYDIGADRMQVSEGYAAIHGLPDGTTETTRSEWRTRVHPEDVERVGRLRRRALRDRKSEHTLEYRIVSPHFGVRWIESRSFILYDSSGVAHRVIGVNIDVTQRKNTEALLNESKARLADALAAGQVMAFEWDTATGLTRRSDNAPLILGGKQSATETSRRNDFLRRVHPDDCERFKAHIRKLSPCRSSYVLTFRFVRPDGVTVWLEETAKGEFDAAGRLLRLQGLTRDITERKEAELALAERTLQLALAERAALVGSVAFEVGPDIMQISAGYAALHGLVEGTTVIPRSSWQALVHPEDARRFDEIRRRNFLNRMREYVIDYRIIRPGGEVRWIEARSFASYHTDGRPHRVVGVNIDITDRKRAEELQRTLNAELDHRVKNVLATVSAVAAHTLDASSSMHHFVASLDGRIRSMARTHELLSEGRWQGISLLGLVRRELAPYAAGTNTYVNGPDVILKAEAGQAMAMVLHELVTNAAKHGALSIKNGCVAIRWEQRLNGRRRSHLVFEWAEIDGPSVAAPKSSGFGTSTIRDLIPYEFGGAVDLTFAPEGVKCRLELPDNWLIEAHAMMRDFQSSHMPRTSSDTREARRVAR
jgi:PAS domain S-box-containing protein